MVKTRQNRKKKQVCVLNGQLSHLLPILSRIKMWKCFGMAAMQVSLPPENLDVESLDVVLRGMV